MPALGNATTPLQHRLAQRPPTVILRDSLVIQSRLEYPPANQFGKAAHMADVQLGGTTRKSNDPD